MDRAALKKGGRYNWIGQPDRLIYMGTKHYPGDRRTWFQFSLVGKDPEVCWCEVLESDLSGFKETTQPTAAEQQNNDLWRLGRSVGK